MQRLSFLLILTHTISCTDQRDLYTVTYPLLLVENNWIPSRTNLSREDFQTIPSGFTEPMATLMIYPSAEPVVWMEDPKQKILSLAEGDYQVLVLNDYIYPDNKNFRKNIQYRGTDSFDSFEAYATPEALPFRASPGERVVKNPDTLATRSTVELGIEGRRSFRLRYKNGKISSSSSSDLIDDSLRFTPCRVVHKCNVIVRVVNIRALNGAGKVKASLRGFAGSNFLANRMPGAEPVTHHFNLNNRIYTNGAIYDGIISGSFSTFGPPLDIPERKYELEIYVQYPSGREAPSIIFDITDQIIPQKERMMQERKKNNPIMGDLIVNVTLALENDNPDWNINVDDWGDEIIIPLPIVK